MSWRTGVRSTCGGPCYDVLVDVEQREAFSEPRQQLAAMGQRFDVMDQRFDVLERSVEAT